MKKAIPIIVAAAMVIAMFAAADADADPDPGLYLNGELVTGTSGDGWTYDSGTKTLTLSGANFTAAHTESSGYSSSGAIYYGNDDTLKIVLNGDGNSVTGLGGGYEKCGIYSAGGLEFSGTGSITISNDSYSNGIMAGKNLTIKGGTITSSVGGNFDAAVSGTTATCGFLMAGGVLKLNGTGILDVNGGAGVKITGGLLQAKEVTAIGGPENDGPFEISGGKIEFSDCVADGILAFGSRNTGSTAPLLITHDAPMENCYIDGNSLKSTAAGNASIGTYTPSDPGSGDGDDTGSDDGGNGNNALLIGGGIAIAVVAVLAIGAFFFMRK